MEGSSVNNPACCFLILKATSSSSIILDLPIFFRPYVARQIKASWLVALVMFGTMD